MKILFLLLCIVQVPLFAQNLVPNPSFEEFLSCPEEVGEFDLILNWSAYRESPDYFNACAEAFVSVPCNRFGCQEPSTGNGYAGLYFFYSLDSYREIIGTQLIEPLIVGQTYFVSFKASPGYGRYFDVKWFSNKLGVKFSMNEYGESNPPPIDNFAHIYTNDIISDTLNWTTISGTVVADAPYEYIMLGNFFDNENTDTLTNGIANYASYYYIDDVCVTTNPLACDFTSGVAEIAGNNVMVYPNPATDVLYISYPDASNPDISIFDMMGQSIAVNVSYVNGLCTVDVNNLSSGTYFLKIKEQSNTISKKFFVNN